MAFLLFETVKIGGASFSRDRKTDSDDQFGKNCILEQVDFDEKRQFNFIITGLACEKQFKS